MAKPSESLSELLGLLCASNNSADVPLSLSGSDPASNALLDMLCPGLAAKCAEANAKFPVDQANAMLAAVQSIEFSDGTVWGTSTEKDGEA